MKSRSKPLPDFFRDTIAMCAPLSERLAGAEIVSEVEATGNYSYLSDACQGENHILLGDAFAFIDPVFSSGVWLAMNSAVAGADLVEARLREPAKEAARRREFERVMRHGPTQFSWFIYRVTNPTMRELFMRPSNALRMKGGADVGARRRHLRPHAAAAPARAVQARLLRLLAGQPAPDASPPRAAAHSTFATYAAIPLRAGD